MRELLELVKEWKLYRSHRDPTIDLCLSHEKKIKKQWVDFITLSMLEILCFFRWSKDKAMPPRPLPLLWSIPTNYKTAGGYIWVIITFVGKSCFAQYLSVKCCSLGYQLERKKGQKKREKGNGNFSMCGVLSFGIN